MFSPPSTPSGGLTRAQAGPSTWRDYCDLCDCSECREGEEWRDGHEECRRAPLLASNLIDAQRADE